MRSLSGIRADLERLEGTLEAMDQAQGSPAVALMRRGLEEIRDDLRTDLEDARRARLDVLLDGAAVTDHEVRIDALAKLLRSLQETVSSVAQALTGKATSRAAIPAPLREQTSLHLAAVYPGSFGAILRGPSPDAGDQTLFDFVDEVPTLLDIAVDRMLTIIDLANGTDVNDDPIIEAVLPLGSRAFKHLTDLSSAIVDERMTAALSWRSPATQPRDVSLTLAAARRLDDVLGRNKMTEREAVLEGRLGTVSDIRNRVELQTDAGDIVAAKVIEEIVPQLATYYTRRVRATFDVTTVRSQVTGEERNAFTLVGLEMADEQGTLDR